LVLASINDPQTLRQNALIPEHLSQPLQTLKNFGWMVSSLFIRTPDNNFLMVGRLPVLNVVQAALLVFGVYALWAAAKQKLAVMLAAVLLAIILAGVNDNIVFLALGIPALAVVISAGLRFLYIEWRGVFPSNPAAKFVALSLMAILVTVHILFGVRYAAVAWPHTIATKNTYVIK
jgi:hypothetical protein